MRLLSLLVAPALFSVAMPAIAAVDDAVHKKCLEARDYKGCVEAVGSEMLTNNQPRNIDTTLKKTDCLVREYAVKNNIELSDNEATTLCNDLLEAGGDIYRKADALKFYNINWYKYREFKPSEAERLAIMSSNNPDSMNTNSKDPFESYSELTFMEREEAIHQQCAEESIDYDWCVQTRTAMSDTEEKAKPATTFTASGKTLEKQYQYDQCPSGTEMVKIDKRWSFLFFKGGNIKEIGCMTPLQAADFKAQVEMQKMQQQSRQMQNFGQGLKNMGNQLQQQQQTMFNNDMEHHREMMRIQESYRPRTCSGSTFMGTFSATCY
jgi:hypothetical protein